MFGFIKKRWKVASFKKLLNGRSFEQWQKAWIGYDLDICNRVCKRTADVMDFPNYYILPEDKISLVMLNPIGDMREIELMLELEDFLDTEFKKLLDNDKSFKCLVPHTKC